MRRGTAVRTTRPAGSQADHSDTADCLYTDVVDQVFTPVYSRVASEVLRDVSMLVLEAGFTLLAGVMAFCWPQAGSLWFAKMEKFFGRLARRRATSVVVVATAAILLRLAILPAGADSRTVHSRRVQLPAGSGHLRFGEADQSHASHVDSTSKASISTSSRPTCPCTFRRRA